MNKTLCLGALAAALAAGCASNSAAVDRLMLFGPNICSKTDLNDGNYNVDTPLRPEIYPYKPAIYYVRENGTNCGLVIRQGDICFSLYHDLGCDNTMDLAYSFCIIDDAGYLRTDQTFSREELLKISAQEPWASYGSVEEFDLALQLGQQFVCKKNRIKK